MVSVNIRPMIPEDWPSVAEIYIQGIKTNLATFETVCPAYEEWDRAHLSVCRLTAEVNGSVVGWCALTPVSSRCVYRGVAEVSIYIDASFARCGIGTRLLNALTEQADQQGIWTLESSIFANNEASIRLHERCGFRLVGVREKLGKDAAGVWRDTVLMEKRSSKIQ